MLLSLMVAPGTSARYWRTITESSLSELNPGPKPPCNVTEC